MQKAKVLLLSFLAIILFTTSQAAAAPDSFVNVVKSTRDGVVHVEVEGTKVGFPMGSELFPDFFGRTPGREREYKFGGLGTGFIIDKTGYIITNNHVIEDASKITVKTMDRKEFGATLVGRDPLTDLALLKIDPKGADLKVLPLGDSDATEIGEWVIAIGSPQGLEWTVTAGIVSAKGRNLGAGPYDSFIQTDASINQGNSGGPLLNMKGQVVGVNSMIYANSQGLGFAVPVNMLQDLLPQLKEGRVSRGWLGVTLQAIDENLAKSFGLSNTDGALIADVVKNEPAALAGLRAGDIVKSVNDKQIATYTELTRAIGFKKPNETVKLGIIRNGKAMTVNVKLGERPKTEAELRAPIKPSAGTPFSMRNLTDTEKSKLGLSGGVVIENVLQDSNPATAGLLPGTVVVSMNNVDIKSAAHLQELYNVVKPGENILMKAIAGGSTRFIGFVKE